MNALIEGQLWQTKSGYLKIGRVGKTLVEFKHLRKPDQRGVQSQMAKASEVEKFLKLEKAKLKLASALKLHGSGE
jgi:hypothetical protein